MIGVFGGSGFIGRNLIDHFTETKADLRLFARRPVPGFETETTLIDFENPETYVRHLDGLTSAVLLVSASVPGTYADDMASEVEQNVLPYSRFLKAVQSSGLRRLVYLSSGGAVYGEPRAERISEGHPTRPISPYGCAKLMIEDMVRAMSRDAPWTYTILRPSNPVGRYQSAGKGQGLVARALDAAVSGGVVEIWGDGGSLRDYFDVRDLCGAISAALTHPAAENETFNVGQGNVYSVSDIIQICSEVSGLDVNRRYVDYKKYLVKDVVIDISKISHNLDWHPNFNIHETVKHCFESLPYSSRIRRS